MEYRVEELARRAGLSVDTVRFYQGRGILPPPERRGRLAIYGERHLARLQQIRTWQREGLSLSIIKRLLQGNAAAVDARLLDAIARERVGERVLTRAELATESGVPEPLIRAVEAAGLVEPIQVGGEERFTEADLEMARAGLTILQAGFPLDQLLELAVRHAGHVQELSDRAIDLFDGHVRHAQAPTGQRPEVVSEAFRELLPQLTRLVALHFQRTLVKRALERLAKGDDRDGLRAALATMGTSRLEVAWR